MRLLKNVSWFFMPKRFKSSHIFTIPALSDNYMYLLINPVNNKALTVDPVEPKKITALLKKTKAELACILTTHHHADHAGGNAEMANLFPHIPIIGGDSRIDNLTKTVSHEDNLTIENFNIKCLFTPCHTSGHISYYIQSNYFPSLCFTGDTLFVGGCGRFFEGTAKDMINALNILQSLPDSTEIYCGHEYTVNNLKFASIVEPSNEELKLKLSWAIETRKNQLPTVPSTIGAEKSYNPFLRINELAVKQFCKSENCIEVMTTLRNLKDQFKAS